MVSPKISVLIINYNSGDRLAKCLACLEAQRFTNFDVWILDNASTDRSAKIASENSALSITVINSPENIGFAAGNNQLAKQASGQWLALLNPDAYSDADWLQNLELASVRYPLVDAFGSTQINAIDRSRLDGVGDVYHAFGVPYRGGFGHPSTNIPPDGECFSPCAAAALYRRATFEALGGFDERFFCYGEDVDLGFRLRLSGGRALQVANAIVHHEGSGVSGRYSDFTVYHGHRNRIWGWFLNMPMLLLIPLLPFHLMINLVLFVRAITNGTAKAYCRGMVDGFGAMGSLLKDRNIRHKNRRVGIIDLIKILSWSPLKIFRRSIDLKPITKNNVP